MSGGDLTEHHIPLPVRLRLGRAAAQTVATQVGADVLHIKGDAVDPSLRPHASTGSDVDLLVRPSHVAKLDEALRAEGWKVYSTFDLGSPFGHAQTYEHDTWGYLDLHRSFPGIRIDADAAFDLLSRGGQVLSFAGVDCPVPVVEAQAAILVLNVARAQERRGSELDRIWTDAGEDRRQAIIALCDELDARVALAAAIGELDRYRDDHDYRLWRAITRGGGRVEEWWGRVRAAPTTGDAVRIALRAPLVNREQLTHRLGRPPRVSEVVLEFFARFARAARELWRTARRPGRHS